MASPPPPPLRGAKYRWGIKISRFSTNNSLYLAGPVAHSTQNSTVCLCHLATGADVLLSLTPSTLSASSARPRRHETIGLRSRTVTPRLPQRNTRWSLRSTLAPLQCVLRVTARVVLDLKPRDHISCALREPHWLPISERIVYKLCLLVYKASLGQSPDYITDMLQPVAATSSRSSLRDASRGDYVVPRTNRKTADRAFSAAAERAWNQLPTELKRTQSTSVFRRGLKTLLFKRAYCSE